MAYEHIKYSLGFVCGPDALAKHYGLVRRRDGKVFVRNYNRPIKNGMNVFRAYERRLIVRMLRGYPI